MQLRETPTCRLAGDHESGGRGESLSAQSCSKLTAWRARCQSTKKKVRGLGVRALGFSSFPDDSRGRASFQMIRMLGLVTSIRVMTGSSHESAVAIDITQFSTMITMVVKRGSNGNAVDGGILEQHKIREIRW